MGNESLPREKKEGLPFLLVIATKKTKKQKAKNEIKFAANS